MRLDRPLRFPLATGASPVMLALGVAVFGCLGGAPIFIGSILPDWTVLPVGLMAAAWVLGLLFTPFEMWRSRASDVELSAEGVRIIGGPQHGRTIAWSKLGKVVFHPLSKEPGGPPASLSFGRVTVRTEDPVEASSLDALGQTLRVLAEDATQPAVAPKRVPGNPDVVHCVSCGAPAQPTEAAETRCRSCGARVAMPAAIAESVRATHTLTRARKDSIQMLRELLAWPAAARINRLLLLALPPLMIAWPVCGALFDEYYQAHDVFGWQHGVVLFLAALSGSSGFLIFTHAQVGLRRAVGLIFATFHATPPDAPGEPYGCRSCGALLMLEPESPLVMCAYCQADNVIGIDLRSHVEPTVAQAQDLDGLLRERRRERRRWNQLAFLALILLLAASTFIKVALHRIEEHPAPFHTPRPPASCEGPG